MLKDTLINTMKKNVLFISDEITEFESKEKKVKISFKNGRILQVDMVLFCGGRVANTDSLDLHLCRTKVDIGTTHSPNLSHPLLLAHSLTHTLTLTYSYSLTLTYSHTHSYLLTLTHSLFRAIWPPESRQQVLHQPPKYIRHRRRGGRRSRFNCIPPRKKCEHHPVQQRE